MYQPPAQLQVLEEASRETAGRTAAPTNTMIAGAGMGREDNFCMRCYPHEQVALLPTRFGQGRLSTVRSCVLANQR